MSMPSNHTLRRNLTGFYLDKRDTLGRSYIPTDDGSMPITAVDELFSSSELEFFNSEPIWEKNFSLNKRELFNNVVIACEEFAIKKTTKYNKNLGLNEIVYEVPALNVNSIVKYSMYINHGKHHIRYSLVMDCITSCPYGHKCRYCRDNGKGQKKRKQIEFLEQSKL
jgi:hypothetical protein